jgi:hypothetical protein
MIPWLNRFTNEQGYQMLCCSGSGRANVLRDAHGNPLHISQGLTDEQLLNSPDLKAIRSAMLHGEWPEACERCRLSEEAGAASSRHHANNRLGAWIEDALKRTRDDGTLDKPVVRSVDIRLGNACNLTCRMCGPSASRLWSDIYNAVQPPGYILPDSQLQTLRDSNWVKRQSVQWLIEQCLPSVESLHFAGGEPLIVPELLEALDICIRSGHANEINLSFNTNTTVLPEKVVKLWPHFRSVSLLCSVDGFGKLNDYIRCPSKWKDIDRNLRKLDEHFQEWKLRSVVLSATVQTYNVLQLGEIFDYLATGFKHVATVPLLTPLFFPGYLSICNLPDNVKSIASDRLLAARAKAAPGLKSSHSYLLSAVDTVLSFMKEPGDKRRLLDFLYFCAKSDLRFGDSWQEACPELARHLNHVQA